MGNFFDTHCLHLWFLPKNNGEGGSSFVQHRPQLEPLDIIEGFLGSLRFEHRSKLDQLGIEIGAFE